MYETSKTITLDRWKFETRGSVGFLALMNYFRDSYANFGRIGGFSKEGFLTLFNQVKLEDKEFDIINFLLG